MKSWIRWFFSMYILRENFHDISLFSKLEIPRSLSLSLPCAFNSLLAVVFSHVLYHAQFQSLAIHSLNIPGCFFLRHKRLISYSIMCLSDAINWNAFGRTDVSLNKKSKWQTRKIEETKTIDMLAKSINPDIPDRIKKIHPKTRMKWWMLQIAVPLIHFISLENWFIFFHSFCSLGIKISLNIMRKKWHMTRHFHFSHSIFQLQLKIEMYNVERMLPRVYSARWE